MSRERESFLERLRGFLSLFGGARTPPTVHSIDRVVITRRMKRMLHRSTSLVNRTHAVVELGKTLRTKALEENQIEKVWCLVKDMLEAQVMPPTCRHVTLQMLTNYVNGEPDIQYMRMVFLKYIRYNIALEEPKPLLTFFRAVVKDGRRTQHVEEEVGTIMSKWLPYLVDAPPMRKDALRLINNLMEFHSMYYKANIVSSFLRATIHIISHPYDTHEAALCLIVLETAISYQYIPDDDLDKVLTALCYILETDDLTNRVHKIVNDILKSPNGNQAYDALLKMMHECRSTQLVQGSMFFAVQVTFGVENLASRFRRKPQLLRAIRETICDGSGMNWEPSVLYEVALSLHKLLTDPRPKLDSRSWDCVVDTSAKLQQRAEMILQDRPRNLIMGLFRDVMNQLEGFVDANVFNGNLERYYGLVDNVRYHRIPSSINKLLNHLRRAATPPQLDWLQRLIGLVSRYFVDDTRPLIKMKTVEILKSIYMQHHNQHGQAILIAVVAELFVNVEKIPYTALRTEVVHFLVLIALHEKCDAVNQVLQMLSKVIMEKYIVPEPTEIIQLEDASDIIVGVDGLVKVFRKKTWQVPSKIAVSAYNILLTFLEAHYKCPKILQILNQTRLQVLRILLSMKSDDANQLGFSIGEMSDTEVRNKKDIVQFSPYVVVSHRSTSITDLQMIYGTHDLSVLLLGNMGKLLLLAVEAEKDWVVLAFILQHLALKLHEKTIVLALMEGKMDTLTSTLLKMIYQTNLNYPRCLKNIPGDFTRSQFESNVYPVLCALAAHHKHMRLITQQQLIPILQEGVKNNLCNQLCIEALTLCVMEMPQAMGKKISGIIKNFTRISQCVSNARTMLEFLSTLLHYPTMYSSFIITQYKFIFAIAIPYTNPFEFNHYIVSLAYHVIDMWFIKCNPNFRREIVRYISKSLKEQLEYLKTYKPTHSPEKKNRSPKEKIGKEKPQNEEDKQKKIQLFKDLMDTCFHLMARYMFAFCVSNDQRSGRLPILEDEGNSQTWLIGEKLLTITTSGCLVAPSDKNICAACNRLCSQGFPALKKMDIDGMRGRDMVEVSDLKFEDSTAASSSKLHVRFSLPPDCPSASQTPPSSQNQRYPLQKSSFSSAISTQPPSTKSSSSLSTPPSPLTTKGSHRITSPTRSSPSTKTSPLSPSSTPSSSSSTSAKPSPSSPLEKPLSSAQPCPSRSVRPKTNRFPSSWFSSPPSSTSAKPSPSSSTQLSQSLSVRPKTTYFPSSLSSPSSPIKPTVSFKHSPSQTSSANLPPTPQSPTSPSNPPSSPVDKTSLAQPSYSPSVRPKTTYFPSSLSSPSPIKPTVSSKHLPSQTSPPAIPSSTPQSPTSPSSPPSFTLDKPSSSEQLSHSPSVKPKITYFPSFPSSPPSPIKPTVSSKHKPTSPSADPSLSTPQSPTSPFAKYPQYSIFQSSPDVSLASSLTSESSQSASSECSPDKIALQTFPSQAASKKLQSEAPLLSRENLHLSLTDVNVSVQKDFSKDVDGRRKDFVKDKHKVSSPPPKLSPVLEDEDVSTSDPLLPGATSPGTDIKLPLCICSCRGWAEIKIRQPCGDFSAMIRFPPDCKYFEEELLQEMSEVNSPTKASHVKESSDPVHGTSKSISENGNEEVIQEDGKQKKESVSSPTSKILSFLQRLGSPKKAATRMAAKQSSPKKEKIGMPPSFVFLQLYYHTLMPKDESRPVLLPTEQEETRRSIRLLDFIQPQDTHKIGVLYVRKGQTTEQEILGNGFGSVQYTKFIAGLGSYLELAKASDHVFVGGLDKKGVDGDSTVVWHDDLMQVVFHIATLMPPKNTDPKFNSKKRHIGNDSVVIVFNESQKPYNPNTIKGQFNHTVIEIVPHPRDVNTVLLHHKPEILKYLKSSNPRLVSNQSLALIVRQIAVHADLAAKIMVAPPHQPYANNWVQRLRHIQKIHNNVMAGIRRSEVRLNKSLHLNDFMDLMDARIRNLELCKDEYPIQLMY